MKRPIWILLAVLCLGIGFYPLLYLAGSGRVGLLQTKSDAVLGSGGWRAGFYAHITCGGVALAVGWVQFRRSWRQRWPGLHRLLGKVYVVTACVSAVAAIGISPLASTGWIAGLGFGTLGVIWLGVTLKAYTRIRCGDVRRHECLMIYSYSACCAAVTLRLWLPFLLGACRLDFAVAYPVVAWLCWVPNLWVARWITSRVSPRVPRGQGA